MLYRITSTNEIKAIEYLKALKGDNLVFEYDKQGIFVDTDLTNEDFYLINSKEQLLLKK